MDLLVTTRPCACRAATRMTSWGGNRFDDWLNNAAQCAPTECRTTRRAVYFWEVLITSPPCASLASGLLTREAPAGRLEKQLRERDALTTDVQATEMVEQRWGIGLLTIVRRHDQDELWCELESEDQNSGIDFNAPIEELVHLVAEAGILDATDAPYAQWVETLNLNWD